MWCVRIAVIPNSPLCTTNKTHSDSSLCVKGSSVWMTEGLIILKAPAIGALITLPKKYSLAKTDSYGERKSMERFRWHSAGRRAGARLSDLYRARME
jgi:hypothetical protein